MSLTPIHYAIIAVVLLILILGVVGAIKQPNKKLVLPMIFSVSLIGALVGAISIAAAEKYTKKVKLVKLDNRRYLTQEKISYFGLVKNVGKYPVKKVYLTIKLVSGGHSSGKIKPGTFYQTSSFWDFLGKGANKLYKPKSIEKEFLIAKDLKPGEVTSFRVTFDYPGYFKNTADFTKVYAH